MKKLILLFSVIILACTAPKSDTPDPQKVLLVSFDGFRADYLSKTDTPNFDMLVEEGVFSEGLIPVFPTVTFPNYYSIATGLFPENTGFIHNSMFDNQIGARFSMGDREQVENPEWYGGEPVWNTVEKNGLNAGTMFWVGSEAPIQNMRPTYWKPYDGNMPNKARIDTVLKWMSVETEQDAEFGTLYFSFVDSRGHRYGPDSREVVQAIQQADSLVGYLISEMKDLGLWGNTNLIIVSDHGMTQLSRERLVLLDKYIDMDDIEIVTFGATTMANVKDSKLEPVYKALKSGEENFRVYKKENLPDRYHLKNHPRVSDLIIVADLGYTITTSSFVEERPDYPSGGTHGFDNLEPEMHALFLAHGPDFRKGLTIPPFSVVHIYPLITHLLDIEPAMVDGSLDSVEVMLN